MESNIIGSKSFSWPDVDWNVLRRLRARFLQFDPGESDPAKSGTSDDSSDYWQTPADLCNYNFTFAERIGWKWDTVLAELKARGWTPPPAGTVLDWGCGTGEAGRRVVEAWPAAVRRLLLWDRSGIARQFAERHAKAAFPNLDIRATVTETPADLLVISHVINELSEEALRRLLAVVDQAQAVLWVEPGTAAVSRRLIAVRERLIGRFRPIAPCTHAIACGMLSAENKRHWCHHFAKIPGYVHVDAGWRRFATTLEIDLTTLPFSFLVLDRRPGIADMAMKASRIIGRPRIYKGFTKVLSCQRNGVHEYTIQKRDAPHLLKELKKAPSSLYRWDWEGERITGGTPFCPGR